MLEYENSKINPHSLHNASDHLCKPPHPIYLQKQHSIPSTTSKCSLTSSNAYGNATAVGIRYEKANNIKEKKKLNQNSKNLSFQIRNHNISLIAVCIKT